MYDGSLLLLWLFKREVQNLICKAIAENVPDQYLIRNMLCLFTLLWISNLTVWKLVFFPDQPIFKWAAC